MTDYHESFGMGEPHEYDDYYDGDFYAMLEAETRYSLFAYFSLRNMRWECRCKSWEIFEKCRHVYRWRPEETVEPLGIYL